MPRPIEACGILRTVLRVAMLCALLVTALAMTARAGATYTYQGNPFTDFSGPSGYACPGVGTSTCRINGSFTVAQPLGANIFDVYITPTVWVFLGGNGEWTSPTSTGTFLISTDASGNITNWAFSLDNQSSNTLTGAPIDDILFSNSGEDFELLHFLNGALTVEASNAGMPGVWTATITGGGGGGITATPEPSGVVLLSTGLGALLAYSLLSKRTAATRA